MRLTPCSFPNRQIGSANLLIALVLSMSITLVTLAVAKTQLTEQRISANSHWHTQLSLEARSRWSDAVANLTDNFESLDWSPTAGSEELVNRSTFTTSDHSMLSSVMLLRDPPLSRYFDVHATSSRDDGSRLSASYNQAVRILTVLAPQAESPPPLILNGCLISASSRSDIRPLNSDTDYAGTAAWLSGAQPCRPLSAFEFHAGQVDERSLSQSLWSNVFSVSTEAFAALAEADLSLPAADRRYWLAGPANFANSRWTQSLGSAERPVALYFSAEVECPRFSDGVVIFGVVFIDNSCSDPIADVRMEIFGSLIVNGDLNAGTANLQLNHIQIADDNLMQLEFPILRSVKVPGSWRDF